MVDPEASTVTTRLDAGEDVFHLAVNPTTNRIYVANCGGKSGVCVLDGGTNTVVAKIPIEFGPCDVAVDTVMNRIYTINACYPAGGKGSISAIDGDTNTVLATIPVDFAPQTLAVNSETHRIYATNSTGDTLFVFAGESLPISPQ